MTYLVSYQNGTTIEKSFIFKETEKISADKVEWLLMNPHSKGILRYLYEAYISRIF